uniref:thioredoxin-dependent peroxiredoxin n=1 Tax=Proboscia inermis TaxID=420281 RepID=A0A7S0CDI9_9STRA|mmetsp:Transcript_39197/g.39668  ORF Transcript_39197/g.39668 Transcript_39197/m.39668 type:complete len:234 (+) Transcript_39197:247-948(+)|eukprot:CAMPEP_0171301908 /NCGR_PEP_ID=MMETSP0816-20121228/11163_1 /TAXON_ID=420281 /ORGANISM="Proboscia inermis, Strain CCAP1064/1" /LENGTH=233 /DNA_ID=CAMNT_0011779869 /DNA_START=165 /DNA_END=866 /DNA_ORIENTATION=+
MVKLNDSYDTKFSEMSEGMMTFVKEKLDDEQMGIMGEAAKKLKESMPDPGIKVGMKAPDFTLKDISGSTTIKLSEELKNGPVVLAFYRGAWCPVCNMHLKALQEIAPTLKSDHNASIIAVTPQMPEVTKKQFEDNSVTYKAGFDSDDAVAKAYGLNFELDPKLNVVYKGLGLNVEACNGDGRLDLPVPATFVIRKNGKIAAAQADTDYMNRMKPDEIVAGLISIKNNGSCVIS